MTEFTETHAKQFIRMVEIMGARPLRLQLGTVMWACLAVWVK